MLENASIMWSPNYACEASKIETGAELLKKYVEPFDRIFS